MRIELNRFPNGRSKALTLSYDDGPDHDRRLVEIMNSHGVRGSFHLNAGTLGQQGRVRAEEIQRLYANHEISAHGLTHPFLDTLPREQIVHEIMEDRRRLEALAGYPVRGMSYPYGAYNDLVLDLLPRLGIEYARTVPTTGGFDMPKDFLTWQGTCHHADHLMENARRFLERTDTHALSLMYVWGHSFEFDAQKNWGVIEEFCALMGKRDDIWYATNIEIVDYVKALRRLRFSADSSMATNLSALPVWISVDGTVMEIPGGATMRLGA